MKICDWIAKVLWLLVLALPFQAQAAYVWFDGGETTVSIGDTVTVDVYLHAEADDGLQMYGLTLGFDDTNVGGGELTYIPGSIVYSDTVMNDKFGSETYQQGTSTAYPGESVIQDINQYSLFDSEELTAGEDLLLFSVGFIFNGGVDDDGEDIWIELRKGEGFGFDSAWVTIGNIEVREGPDYTTAAVPVPAAAWLLGSGMIGLMGVRRKKI